MSHCALLMILSTIFIMAQVKGQEMSHIMMSDDELVTESTAFISSADVSRVDMMTISMQTYVTSSVMMSSSIVAPSPTIASTTEKPTTVPTPTPVLGKGDICRCKY